MTIQSEDIKLLKSAVMADTSDGGGAMTGVEVVDGVSNNMFNDVSSDDRASGRVSIRKVFGVAHTDNTDTLLGASFAIMSAPEDPLVHVSLFETEGWSDTRDKAQEAVEQYLVKGPKLLCRIQDVHYQNALTLQLYNIAPAASFPDPGSSVVLRNPSGQEQYIRIYRTTISQQTVILDSQPRQVNLCSCELSQPLEFDVLGKPVQAEEPSSATTAVVYSTNPAVGANFHGIKTLGVAAEIGDRSVTVADGIFTPVVPAATVEEPVIDVYPLARRPTLSPTAFGTLQVDTSGIGLSSNLVLYLPTAAEPGSLTFLTVNGTLSVNVAGDITAGGTTIVGQVNWSARTITFLGNASGTGITIFNYVYRPASVNGATAYSDEVEITTANQGLSFVAAIEPPPAPGTMSVSFMAQGRWYELFDNGTGKLSGADSSYGVGTVSFLTGSLALTLGAIPDVGSSLIFTWGDGAAAKQATGTLPTRASMRVVFDDAPQPGTLSFSWPVGGSSTRTATVDANGVVTGPASVSRVTRAADGTYSCLFTPNEMPAGPVVVSYTKHVEGASFTANGGGSFTVEPHKPGSLRFRAIATAAGEPNRVVECYSKTDGILYAEEQPIGSVNAATGAISISTPTFNVARWKTVKVAQSLWI